MTTEDDDDESFGDFTFSTAAVNSNLKTNGSDLTVNDDDDWGDFVNSAALSRSESLPVKSFGSDKPFDPFSFFIDHPNVASQQNDVAVPDSAPSRIQWMKPKGALSLSMFGEAEEEENEEEKSSAAGVLFNVATEVKTDKDAKKEKKMGSNLNVNDLISDLYKQSEQSKDANGKKMDTKESDLNLRNLSSDGLKSESNGLDLKRSVSNLDSNGLNWRLGEDDGWEFKGAETKLPAGDFNIKSDLQVKAENVPISDLNGFNSSWDVLGSDFNGARSKFNGNLDPNQSSLLVNESEDFGDDDGWEFKVAESDTRTEDGVLGSDFNGARSKFNGNLDPNQSSLLDNESKDFGDEDGWEFKVAESDTRTEDGDSKVNSKALDNPEGVKHTFRVGNVADVPTNLFIASDGNSQKSSGLDFGFDFNKSSVTPNGISSNSFSDSTWKDYNKNGLNSTPVNGYVGNDLFVASDGIPQKSGGLGFGFDFGTSSVTPNYINSNSFLDSKLKDDNKIGLNSAPVNRDVANNLFVASDGISQKSGEMDFGFDFSKSSVTPNGISSNSFSESKQKDDNKIGVNSTPVNGNVDNGENFWTFKDAFSESGSKDKGNKVKMENHKGALPLSFFGDGENVTGDPLVYQNALAYNLTPSTTESPKKSFSSNIPINDLVSSLYSQAEQITSVNHTRSQSDNQLGFTQKVMDSNLIDGDGDGDGDFDDDSWEFKAAFSGTIGENQTSTPAHEDSHMKYSTKMEQKDYEDFYSKLKDELCVVAQCHFDNLKKARSTDALGGKDAEVKALDKEIQDLYHELHQDSIISREPRSENHLPSNICLDKFVEVLQDPKFHALESEYHLTKRLTLAEKDWRSSIELLKHTASTLKILTLGSMEEQSNYVSAWFRMMSVCAQELRHGASIWKQSTQKNIHSQILSDPRGKQYILALGEIYRVVEVLGSSAKLYKPWVLLSYADPTGMFTLLNECSNLWSSSGLEKSFQSISDPTGFNYDGTPKELVESVKFIHNLDALTLHNHVFCGQGPTCRLSLLTAGTVPGLKMVVWNGEHYFLTLANLWANLISIDPPNQPHVHVG